MKQNNYIICSHISILPNHPLFGLSHVHNTISTSFAEYSFEIFTTIVLPLICWFRIWSIYSDYASLGLLHRPSPRHPRTALLFVPFPFPITSYFSHTCPPSLIHEHATHSPTVPKNSLFRSTSRPSISARTFIQRLDSASEYHTWLLPIGYCIKAISSVGN